MKCLAKVSALVFMIPLVANAGWQVAKPDAAAPSGPFFQAPPAPSTKLVPVSVPVKVQMPSAYAATAFPNQFATLGRPVAVYAVSISGSLKENLERIMGRYHWRVVWKSPYDYNFDGRVTGTSLPSVVNKILHPFPLQAVMYMSNRTMLVVPRSA